MPRARFARRDDSARAKPTVAELSLWKLRAAGVQTSRRGNDYRVTDKQDRRLPPHALNDICALCRCLCGRIRGICQPRRGLACIDTPFSADHIFYTFPSGTWRNASVSESSDPLTFASVFADDPRVGGRRGTGDRKGVHGGSRGERRAHSADAEMRPQ